jgi:hypothetical protein
MTAQQICKLADFYLAALVRAGAQPRKRDENLYGGTGAAYNDHLAWACTYIKKLATEHGVEGIVVAQQWLGFVQGALWAWGIFTPEEMREHDLEEFPNGGTED